MVEQISIGIIANSLTQALSISDKLDNYNIFEVSGIFVCCNDKNPRALTKNIPIYNEIEDFSGKKYDIVLSTVEEIDYKSPIETVFIISYNPESFFSKLDILLNSSTDKKLDIAQKKLNTLLNTLNFVQAVIEVADAEGNIKYVNPEFTRLTGIPYQQRINQNVFKVSPNGGLAKCLRLRKEIRNYRTKIGGTDIEVISYASPIIVNGTIQGAVVICNEINDVLKIMDELKNVSNKMKALSTSNFSFDDIIGQNKKLKETICLAKKAAESDAPVLILGETGTGKELIAHGVHSESSRRSMPFVIVNCAAIPDNLMENEFFGHEKGAFTGAVSKKIGKFELADKGTIFLDEIGELDLNLQTKLLRVLEYKVVEPLGASKPKKIDVRVISATNRDLKKMIAEGRFREDLYYRLNVIEINVPPLRERKDDIPLLVEFFIKKINKRLGKSFERFTEEAIDILKDYEWPGNVRELENLIEKLIITEDKKIIDAKALLESMKNKLSDHNEFDTDEIYSLHLMEKRMITKALKKYGDGVLGKQLAAQKLNISLSTLYNKIHKYSIC